MKNITKILILIAFIPLFCSCASEKSAMIWSALLQGAGQTAPGAYNSVYQQNVNMNSLNKGNPYFK